MFIESFTEDGLLHSWPIAICEMFGKTLHGAKLGMPANLQLWAETGCRHGKQPHIPHALKLKLMV